MTIIGLLLAAAATQPLGLRADVASLGRGVAGTVVGVAVQVAPEDRERAGRRVRVEVMFLKGETVVDRGAAVVDVAADGSFMIYREWPPGEGAVRVTVDGLDGAAHGAWAGTFVVPVEQHAFEAPPGAPSDAIALTATAPPVKGVQFLPPAVGGGIGAMQLEVTVPDDTARVEFFQDDEALVQRQRPPWTVSVNLGEVAKRTRVRAAAYRADGSFIGEDVLVLNGPSGQLPVEILLGPAPKPGEPRRITVSVSSAAGLDSVVLKGDDRELARWTACPCVALLTTSELAGIKVLSAEATSSRGVRGEAVQLLGESGFASEIRVEQVELPVVVLDREGRLQTSLPRDAFRVVEDGAEVPIDTFATVSNLPLSLGVAVDVSGSMKQSFPEVRRAVGGFLEKVARPGDRFYLMTFSWDAKLQVEWTTEPRLITDALERIEPDGGTSLHDAVVRALEQFRSRRGRNAIVLLTDGDDTTSRTGWDVALRYARTARTPVFAIGFGIGKLDFFLRDRLKDLTTATGGEAFFTKGREQLDEVYEKISEQLRAQYLISYRSPSTKPAREFRTVRVEVKGEGLTARTIAGYFPNQ